MRRIFPCLALMSAVLLTLIAPHALAQARTPPDYERWYSLTLVDSKAGYSMAKQETGDDGLITTTSLFKFEISRKGKLAEMVIRTVFVEDDQFNLQRVEFRQNLSTGTSVEATYLFDEDGVVKVSSHMGDERRIRRPHYEVDYFSPVETRNYVVSMIDSGAESFKYVSLDPMSGLKPIQTVMNIEGPAKVRVFGKEFVALRTNSVASNAAGIRTTEFLDEQGLPVLVETKLGAMSMRLVAATKEEALLPAEGNAPELFTPTLVKVDPPIDGARGIQSASFLLEVSEGELPDLLTGGAHRFERLSETTGRVRIDLNNPAAAPIADASDSRFIKPTTYANTEDTRIIQMADGAMRDAPADRTARAEILRTFVYKFIESKNLGTGFATASEVCRTGEGDCSEHAVLLAALLRAERIPSRVVSGLIYADAFAGERSVFGFHMWTQALLVVDGKHTWVDLDAVLPEGVTMDAAHIAVSTFDLSDSEFVSSMVPVVSLLGTLSVEVESVSVD